MSYESLICSVNVCCDTRNYGINNNIKTYINANKGDIPVQRPSQSRYRLGSSSNPLVHISAATRQPCPTLSSGKFKHVWNDNRDNTYEKLTRII
jgi:hypothetical protein